MRRLFRLRRHESASAKLFTGNCMVRMHTGDGFGVGPCWHSTYNGVCPTHGDVSRYLTCAALDPTIPVEPWPHDFQLPMYDGTDWGERLRARQERHDKRTD